MAKDSDMRDGPAAGMDGGRRGPLWKRPALITALVLLIPLLGNHFVDGWNWPPLGFALFGGVVFVAALTYERITRSVDSVAYRIAVGIALAASLILVWMNRVQAADDVNPHALQFLAVPLVAIIGVALARFRPVGMARALYATALAQALLLATTLVLLESEVSSAANDPLRTLGLNGFVLILYLGSALLFRRATRAGSAATAV